MHALSVNILVDCALLSRNSRNHAPLGTIPDLFPPCLLEPYWQPQRAYQGRYIVCRSGQTRCFFFLFFLQGPRSLSSPPPAAQSRRRETRGIVAQTPRLTTRWRGRGGIRGSGGPLNSRGRCNKRFENRGGGVEKKKEKSGDICVPLRFKCVLLGLSFLDPRLPAGVVSV